MTTKNCHSTQFRITRMDHWWMMVSMLLLIWLANIVTASNHPPAIVIDKSHIDFGTVEFCMKKIVQVTMQLDAQLCDNFHILSYSSDDIQFGISIDSDSFLTNSKAISSIPVYYIPEHNHSSSATLKVEYSQCQEQGSFVIHVQGRGIPNDYGVFPITENLLYIYETFTAEIKMHNPHSSSLVIQSMELHGEDFHLSKPAEIEEWILPPGATNVVGTIELNPSSVTQYESSLLMVADLASFVVPIRIAVVSEIQPVPENLKFSLIKSHNPFEGSTSSINLCNFGEDILVVDQARTHVVHADFELPIEDWEKFVSIEIHRKRETVIYPSECIEDALVVHVERSGADFVWEHGTLQGVIAIVTNSSHPYMTHVSIPFQIDVYEGSVFPTPVSYSIPCGKVVALNGDDEVLFPLSVTNNLPVPLVVTGLSFLDESYSTIVSESTDVLPIGTIVESQEHRMLVDVARIQSFVNCSRRGTQVMRIEFNNTLLTVPFTHYDGKVSMQLRSLSSRMRDSGYHFDKIAVDFGHSVLNKTEEITLTINNANLIPIDVSEIILRNTTCARVGIVYESHKRGNLQFPFVIKPMEEESLRILVTLLQDNISICKCLILIRTPFEEFPVEIFVHPTKGELRVTQFTQSDKISIGVDLLLVGKIVIESSFGQPVALTLGEKASYVEVYAFPSVVLPRIAQEAFVYFNPNRYSHPCRARNTSKALLESTESLAELETSKMLWENSKVVLNVPIDFTTNISSEQAQIMFSLDKVRCVHILSTPSHMYYGLVNVGDTLDMKQIKLHNPSHYRNLQVSIMLKEQGRGCFDLAFASESQISSSSSSFDILLAPHEEFTFSLKFTPHFACMDPDGLISSSIILTNNLTGVEFIQVQATGTVSQLTLLEGPVSLVEIVVGEGQNVAQQTLEFYNSGKTSFRLQDVSIVSNGTLLHEDVLSTFIDRGGRWTYDLSIPLSNCSAFDAKLIFTINSEQQQVIPLRIHYNTEGLVWCQSYSQNKLLSVVVAAVTLLVSWTLVPYAKRLSKKIEHFGVFMHEEIIAKKRVIEKSSSEISSEVEDHSGGVEESPTSAEDISESDPETPTVVDDVSETKSAMPALASTIPEEKMHQDIPLAVKPCKIQRHSSSDELSSSRDSRTSDSTELLGEETESSMETGAAGKGDVPTTSKLSTRNRRKKSDRVRDKRKLSITTVDATTRQSDSLPKMPISRAEAKKSPRSHENTKSKSSISPKSNSKFGIKNGHKIAKPAQTRETVPKANETLHGRHRSLSSEQDYFTPLMLEQRRTPVSAWNTRVPSEKVDSSDTRFVDSSPSGRRIRDLEGFRNEYPPNMRRTPHRTEPDNTLMQRWDDTRVRDFLDDAVDTSAVPTRKFDHELAMLRQEYAQSPRSSMGYVRTRSNLASDMNNYMQYVNFQQENDIMSGIAGSDTKQQLPVSDYALIPPRERGISDTSFFTNNGTDDAFGLPDFSRILNRRVDAEDKSRKPPPGFEGIYEYRTSI